MTDFCTCPAHHCLKVSVLVQGALSPCWAHTRSLHMPSSPDVSPLSSGMCHLDDSNASLILPCQQTQQGYLSHYWTTTPRNFSCFNYHHPQCEKSFLLLKKLSPPLKNSQGPTTRSLKLLYYTATYVHTLQK